MKIYAREEKKFELDCQSVYLLLTGQRSPRIISETKGFDDLDTIEEKFHRINLLKCFKRICYNYKTQEDPLHAIIKATGTLYSTKQRKDETTKDFALSTDNRLAVYVALGGTVLNTGVNEHVAHGMYKKKYIQLDAAEKQNFDTNSVERVTTIIIFGNTDKKRFGKLQKEVHNDNLKNQEPGIALYQREL